MRKIFFSIVLAFAAAAAHADTLILKGGGSLEGKVVSATDREIVLDTSQGRVVVDADRVARVDYAPAVPSVQAPAPFPPEYRRAWRRRPVPSFGPRQQSLSIDFGLAVPLSSVDFSAIGGGSADDGDVGPLVGMQYLYYASPRVGLGLEFNYYDRSATDSPGLLPSAFSHVSGDSLLFLGDLKLALTDRGPARPYLLLGAGAHRTTTAIDARPDPGFSWSDTGTDESRRLADGAEWGGAISVRLGLDFGFIDPSVFALEAGWTGLLNAGYRATEQGQVLGLGGTSGMLNYFTFAGRWGWTF